MVGENISTHDFSTPWHLCRLYDVVTKNDFSRDSSVKVLSYTLLICIFC